MAASASALSPFISIRSSSSPPSSPSPSPSPSASVPKPASRPRKHSLADQLQPLSKEFLDRPPPSRPWTSASRRKARDSTPDRSLSSNVDRWSSGASAVKDALVLLEKADETEQSVAAALDDQVSSLSSKDIVAIINGERSWRRALLFFNWLKANGSFPLNVYVYNVLLKALRRAEKWEIGHGLVEEMIREGIRPDNITYSTIISFAIRCRHTDEAVSWFERMQEAGCVPDAITYSAMIDVLTKAGRMDEALDLYSKMKHDGLACDVIAYTVIIKLHGMQRNYDEMFNVYEEMKSNNMAPNVITYNSMISILGNEGRSLQVMRLFDDMSSAGLKPSPVTLSLLFRSFAKSRDSDEAFQFYEQVKKEGWEVDTVVYNTLLSLCAHLGKVDEGEQIYKDLLSSKVCEPDDWTWRTLADMYVKGGKFEEGRRIVLDMVNKGHTIDLPVYMGLIQGYGRKHNFKTVLELVDEIKATNVPFDHMLGGALLSVLVLCEEAGGEDSAAILDKIGLAYPKLKSVVEMFVKEDFSREEVKEDLRAMLSGAAEDCRRPFCNLLMDLFWVKNKADRAHQILAIAISFGVYDELQTRSPVEWSLKLRTLSFGAAHTALEGWVSSLRVALKEHGDLPHLLSIEVGVGILYSPDETVRVMSTFILTLLKEMQAPFEESRSGWLTADASSVKAWLLSSDESTEDSHLQNASVSVQL